jgi:hypothetical protein
MKKKVANVYSFSDAVRDRRMAIERRKFTYANCIPERRSGEDRRCIGSAAYHGCTTTGDTGEIKWECCQ